MTRGYSGVAGQFCHHLTLSSKRGEKKHKHTQKKEGKAEHYTEGEKKRNNVSSRGLFFPLSLRRSKVQADISQSYLKQNQLKLKIKAA